MNLTMMKKLKLSPKNAVRIILSANFFASMIFWTPVFFPFLLSKGLEVEQGLFLISLTQISTLIAEYPTGVIGDLYGHKISVISGRLILSIGCILFLLVSSFPALIITCIIFGIGAAMISGSNTAMLFSNSKQFDKDVGKTQSLSLIGAMIASLLGGLLGSINIAIPILLSAIAYGASALIIIPIKNEISEENVGNNIFEQSLKGLKVICRNKKLMTLIIFSSIITMYTFSQKWMLNSIYEANNINITSLGLVIAAIFLLLAIGSALGKKLIHRMNLLVITLIFTLIIAMFVPNIFYVIVILLIQSLLLGIIGVGNQIKSNKMIKQSIRASVISIGSLLRTLLSSIYLFIAGILISDDKFPLVMVLMVIIISTSYIVYLSVKPRGTNPAS